MAYDDDRKKAVKEAEEYRADAPVKRVDSHQRSGAAIIDPNDSLQNRASITDAEGNTQTYGVGDYVEGLGNIEDIDEHGNPTILPDDPEQPAYRLGQSEQGPEGRYPDSDRLKAVQEALASRFSPFNNFWGDAAQQDTRSRLSKWADEQMWQAWEDGRGERRDAEFAKADKDLLKAISSGAFVPKDPSDFQLEEEEEEYGEEEE